MKKTIREVAKKANVSVATVSRIFNSPEKVKDDTKKRVLEVIRKLKYSPHTIARSLAKRKTELISVVFPEKEINAYYFYKLLTGIFEEVSANNFNLLVERGEYEIGKFPVEGYIFVAPLKGSKPIMEAKKRNIKAVFINVRERGVLFVDLDNVEAGYKITSYLIGLGHRKILFIGGMKDNYNTIDRLKGYRKALLDFNIGEEYIVYGDYTVDSGYRLVKNVFAERKDITAIFACNDLMAIGVIRGLKELSIKVPDDVSVIGFDDIDITKTVDPPLSTFRQPFEEIGRKAVNLLFKEINNKREKSLFLKGELVIRDSTGGVR
ncbi:MAG: hypothetical protein DRI36_01085 [Caldiserica bacterium]|nr:MAG: hypothetical protein DRI36_01085 [Caldisericota bacterium]